MLLLIIDIQY